MISKRLSKIVDFVPPFSNVADVGSDHCLVPIELSKRRDVGFLQAIDNKKGPYLTMEKAVGEAGLDGRIELSLSSGLTCLDPRVDTLVLAGMGGSLALSILKEGKEKLERIGTIILDPHKDLESTRSGVYELGYYIDDEDIVFEDGLYYFITRYKRGKVEPYSKADLLFGPINRKRRSPIYKDFLLEQKKRIQGILQKPLSIEARIKYNDMLGLINAELSRR